MSTHDDRIARDRAALREAAGQGPAARGLTYLKLSGPGWLQGAITLGGGSLAGGLYLGVLSGYGLLWLQPLAMAAGVAMLIAIVYVTLSTGRRPLALMTKEVNPVLGWGWAGATLMANTVWCLPQFSLATGVMRQNLFPEMLGGEGGLAVTVAILAATTLAVIISYERGGRGMVVFEAVMKLLVGVIVLCFVAVVVRLGLSGALGFDAIAAGFVPDAADAWTTPATLKGFFDAAGAAGAEFWGPLAAGERRDVMLTAVAVAVGINMTFLLPNSVLDRGWDRDFRGLAVFDLGLGLFIPFLIATSCVVIASASQFHGAYNEQLVAATPDGAVPAEVASGKAVSGYLSLLDRRLAWERGADEVAGLGPDELVAARAALPEADKRLAAILTKRDAADLADALAPLTGATVARIVFGVGVLAMALSTAIVLMLINGYVFSEAFDAPRRGVVHFCGALVPLAFGVVAPFVWSEAMFWLAVPTSVFGIIFLPIAYASFLMLMNSRRVLGDDTPRGGTRVAINIVLCGALLLATFGAGWSIWARTAPFPGLGVPIRWVAIAAAVAFAAAAVACRRTGPAADGQEAADGNGATGVGSPDSADS